MMGLMWFDNTPKKGLQAKVEEAVARYMAKCFEMPNVVEVNPLDWEQVEMGKIAVRARRNIQRFHLLVGREEASGWKADKRMEVGDG